MTNVVSNAFQISWIYRLVCNFSYGTIFFLFFFTYPAVNLDNSPSDFFIYATSYKDVAFLTTNLPPISFVFNTRNPCWLSEILFVWLVSLRCFVWADSVCHLDCVVWPLEKSQCLSQASSHSWERIRNTSWIFYLLTLSQFDYDKSPVFERSPRMWQKYQQLKGIERK